MAITRTPMIDDDGSGTTGTILNNAWKQEFYDQIDALALGLSVVSAPWTPIDASGAGLTLTVVAALYARLDRLVFAWGHVVYPATSNTNPAQIGGLPVANTGMYGGFYQTFGPPTKFHLPGAATAFFLLNPSTMGSHPNATLSGAQLIFNGVYIL